MEDEKDSEVRDDPRGHLRNPSPQPDVRKVRFSNADLQKPDIQP
eukprot:UN14314